MFETESCGEKKISLVLFHTILKILVKKSCYYNKHGFYVTKISV